MLCTKSHIYVDEVTKCCTLNHIYVAKVTKKHVRVVKCQCWILSVGATSCRCPFHTDLSRWFHVYNVRKTGISRIILSRPQATLTTAFCNHEVTQWHLRTEATHGHTIHDIFSFPFSKTFWFPGLFRKNKYVRWKKAFNLDFIPSPALHIYFVHMNGYMYAQI